MAPQWSRFCYVSIPTIPLDFVPYEPPLFIRNNFRQQRKNIGFKINELENDIVFASEVQKIKVEILPFRNCQMELLNYYSRAGSVSEFGWRRKRINIHDFGVCK